jgi:hypothetical protein
MRKRAEQSEAPPAQAPQERELTICF